MADTKPGSFTALPAATDMTGFVSPLVDAGVTQYKASLARLRGNKIYSFTDYGAVGDGSTDDRAAVQALVDQNDTDAIHGTFWVPQGDYRLVASGGQAIDLKRRCNMRGEHRQNWTTTRSSRLSLEGSGADDLFYLSSSNALWYSGSAYYDLEMFCTNGNTVSNQDVWQYGDGATHGSADSASMYMNLQWTDFSGRIFNLDHTGGGCRWGSSALVSHVTGSNCGGFMAEPGHTNEIMGTNCVFLQTHFNGSWNDQSPASNYFDWKSLREINIYNLVLEGSGPGVAQNAYFYWGGNTWLVIDGLHFEITTFRPTSAFEFALDVNTTATRRCLIRNGGFFDEGASQKIIVCDHLTLESDHFQGIDTRGLSSADFIDETSADLGNGRWTLILNTTMFAPTIDPRHIGRVICRRPVDSSAVGGYIEDAPAAEFNANRDGWFMGLSSAGVSDTQRFGTGFFNARFDAHTYNMVGIVDDAEEGRVFALRTEQAVDLEWETILPSEYLGTTTAGQMGAMVSAGMRWKIIYAGTAYRQLFWNSGGSSGASGGGVNTDFNTFVSGTNSDIWYNTFAQFLIDDDGGQIVTSNAGSGSPSETLEFRVAWFALGLASSAAKYHAGGGGYAPATANQNPRPLEWYDDGDWTASPTTGIFGDYKLGDKVWKRAPAAVEVAWAASTAYVVDDYVISDTDRIYVCVKAGTSDTPTGPTGTTNNIVDNTCEWDYVTLTTQSVYLNGYICTSAGGKAPAWVALTAYKVGDWVHNDTNKIYKCVTAGTSDTSGGPTGTSPGITDATVTWDYHDAEAVFTAMTNVAV